MLTVMGDPTTMVVGDYFSIAISYDNGMGGGMHHIQAKVGVNMDGAKLLGTYNANCIYNYMEGMTITIELYDNGYANMRMVFGEESMTEQMTYSLEGTLLSLDIDGVQTFFTVSEEAKELMVYQPEGDITGNYTYATDYMKITYTVYGKYQGAGDYYAQVVLNDEDMNTTLTILVYLDQEKLIFRSLILGEGEFTFDDAGMLMCKHNYQEEYSAPTCTESGWKRVYCNNCGDSTYEMIPPLGHIFDENGICQNCGMDQNGEDTDFEQWRQEMMQEVQNRWKNMEMNGYVITDDQIILYKEYLSAMRKAQTKDELAEYYDVLNQLMDEIEQGGDVNQEQITEVVLETALPPFPMGMDQQQYIEEYVLGKVLTVYTNYGNAYSVAVDWNNLKYWGDTDTIGSYFYLEIHYSINHLRGSYSTEVSVVVDLSDATSLGIYNADCLLGNVEGASMTIELYDNGYAMLNGTYGNEQIMEQLTYTLQDGVLCLEAEGIAILFGLNEEAKAIEPLLPAGDSIGVYTYTCYGMNYTLTVYGEYTGAGQYMATVQMQEGEISSTLTVYVFLDLEEGYLNCPAIGETDLEISEKGLLTCIHQYFGNMMPPTCTDMGYQDLYCLGCDRHEHNELAPLGHNFDENGICQNCGMDQNGDDKDLETIRQEMMQEVQQLFRNMVMMGFVPNSDQQSRFDKYLSRMEIAQTKDELEKYYDVLNRLLDEIENGEDGNQEQITEVVLESDLPPFPVGMDQKQYIEGYVIGNLLVVYTNYGNTYPVSIDWNNLKHWGETDTIDGCLYIEIHYSVNGIDGSFQIQVMVDSGVPSDEFEQRRQEMIAEMQNRWNNIQMKDPVAAAASKPHFENYLSMMEDAKTEEDLATGYDKLNQLLKQLEQKEEIYVQEVHVEGIPTYVYAGTDIEEFFAQLMETGCIVLRYSDGKEERQPLTREMLSCQGTTEAVGNEFRIVVEFRFATIGGSHSVRIDVIADVTKATLLGIYNADSLGVISCGPGAVCKVELYDNGYAVLYIRCDGEEEVVQVSYTEENGKIEILFDGVEVLFTKNEETKNLDNYIPETEKIGNYIFTQNGVSASFETYGPYTEAGRYLAVMTLSVQISADGETVDIPMTVYVDLDLEAMTFSCKVMGGIILKFDEAGNLFCDHIYVENRREPTCEMNGYVQTYCQNCGEEGEYTQLPAIGHNFVDGVCQNCNMTNGAVAPNYPDLYQEIDQFMMKMDQTWKELSANYEVTEEQIARYEELHISLKEVEDRKELDHIRVMFNDLVKEVTNTTSGDTVVIPPVTGDTVVVIPPVTDYTPVIPPVTDGTIVVTPPTTGDIVVGGGSDFTYAPVA